jgi:hypothetical protein
MKTVLYAAVGTGRHQHGQEVRAVRRRSGNMVKDDDRELNLYALNQLVKMFVFI